MTNIFWKPTLAEFEELMRSKGVDAAGSALDQVPDPQTPKLPTKLKNKGKRSEVERKVDRRRELHRIAENVTRGLNDPDNGFIYLPQEDAELLKVAFNAFCSGKAKTLDLAFGVKRGRGAPKRGPSEKNTAAHQYDFVQQEELEGVGERDWY